jgi:hypothetical protein
LKDEDVTVSLRAFKKKTSVINNAKMVVTVADTQHHRKLYTRFQGSNFELAKIVTKEGRPFIKNEKVMLDKGEHRKELAKKLKSYITCTKNGMVVDWNGFANVVEKKARELLIEDRLGLSRLDPITIQRKEDAHEGSDTPLVATGQLAEAIICYPEYGE